MEWPNAWCNDPESRDQADLTINCFNHETIDVARYPLDILDDNESDYLIQEETRKPEKHFQSFHFHHASAGDKKNQNQIHGYPSYMRLCRGGGAVFKLLNHLGRSSEAGQTRD